MRIVSLLPSATEIVCALGLREQLVAVSHECDYPPEVAELPRITSSILPEGLEPAHIDAAVVEAVRDGKALYQIDGDKLLDLEPDLVVTQGVCDVCAVSTDTVAETLKFLPNVVADATRTLSLSGKTVAGILRDVRLVAGAAGVEERAEALVEPLRERWERLEASKPDTLPTVLMLEWLEPPFYGGHWVPEQVAAAGGVSVMGRVGQDSQRTTWSDIAEADPDLVVVMACGYGVAQNAAFALALYNHPEASRLRAVAESQVYACDANSFFSRPGPRVVRGAELLRQIFTGQGTEPHDAVRVTAQKYRVRGGKDA